MLLLHVVCAVLYIVNAVQSYKKSAKVLWGLGALCWVVNIIIDIAKIIIL